MTTTTPPQTGPLSIVVVGAHMDDYWYGMGGTLLKAARRGHRVTLVQAVSSYCSWPVVRGREAEIKPHLEQISESTGIRLVTLGHDYLRLEARTDLITQISKTIHEAKADVVFCPWEEDHNQDHVAVGGAARIASFHGQDFLAPDANMKHPHQVLQYPLDPNTSFRPDTFVNTEEVVFDLMELSSVFDKIYSKHPLWPDALRRLTITDHYNKDRTATLTRQNEYMFALSMVRGLQCGARYADGFKAYNSVPVNAQLLAALG
jgi:LmbE family N-acetylglucosaminyl deacetylase